MVVRELAGGHRSEIGHLTTTTPPTHPQLPEKHSLREGAIAIPTSQLYKIKGFTWAVKVKKAKSKMTGKLPNLLKSIKHPHAPCQTQPT